MTHAPEIGAILAPPVPALYAKPQTPDDMVHYTVARALDLLNCDVEIPRWRVSAQTARNRSTRSARTPCRSR